MTNFLNKSNYSNWTSPKSSVEKDSSKNDHKKSTSIDHFFKTTK